jgi:hypothetical protein
LKESSLLIFVLGSTGWMKIRSCSLQSKRIFQHCLGFGVGAVGNFGRTADKIVEIVFIRYELLANHITFTASIFMSAKCKTKMKNLIYMHINVDIK